MDDDAIYRIETIKSIFSQLKELSGDTQYLRRNTINWDNFNKYKEEVNERLTKVEQTCQEYSALKEGFVKDPALLIVKSEVLGMVLSKEDFHNYIKEQDKKLDILQDGLKESSIKLNEINTKLAIFDWSYCTFRELIKQKWFQVVMAILGFMIISLLLNDINTTLGRLIDLGYIKL